MATYQYIICCVRFLLTYNKIKEGMDICLRTYYKQTYQGVDMCYVVDIRSQNIRHKHLFYQNTVITTG